MKKENQYNTALKWKKLMKKILIATTLLCSSYFTYGLFFKKNYITDVSKLTKTLIKSIYTPKSIEKLQAFIRENNFPLSIAGGRYSQGGQIAYQGGIVIDIRKLDTIINFDKENKQITVQTGILWRDIQKYIDQHNLSISVMQSYNDFSVGGSLSVNVHGRNMQYGQLIETVKSIDVMLADGTIISANRDQNYDIFRAAIGGYGLVGIITQVTLQLTDNIPIEREIQVMDVAAYKQYFDAQIKPATDIIFHNANIYPPELTTVIVTNWRKTDKPVTVSDHMQKESGWFFTNMLTEQLVRRIPTIKKLRPHVEKLAWQKEEVVWRNYEMSYTVKALEPLVRFPTTTVLQEYFIPVERFDSFMNRFRTIIHDEKVNLINLSVRHVPKNTESMLTYAPQESFSFVLYINILNTEVGRKEASIFTRKLIQAALDEDGTYYLPYQLYATRKQFLHAYPNFDEFMRIKDTYDPKHIFRNMLFDRYE